MALKAFLGADLEEKTTDGFAVIKSVRAGSPAYEQGLNAKDQIIALDGARLTRKPSRRASPPNDPAILYG